MSRNAYSGTIALLQVDDEEAAEFQMVKQQVEMEFPFTDFDAVLSSDEGEALSKLQKTLL